MTNVKPLYPAGTDAFGQELLAYLENGSDIEVIEREDGFIDGSPHVNMYFAPYAEWSPLEQEAIGCVARGPAGGRALDIGCGAGRVSLYLQEQGIEAVGIDVSPGAIQISRERGVHDARLMSITQVGPQLGMFDNIVMFGNNWGLMGSFQRARWLLRRFAGITTPPARIIAITNDVYATDNPVHLAYQAWNRARGRMSGQLRLRVLHHMYRSNWFDYLIVSRDEIQKIIEGTGWRVERFIDGPGSGYAVVIEKK